MAGVRVGANPGPGRESRPRRRVISSDEAVGVDVSARAIEVDSDDVPLVSPNPVNVVVVGEWERDLPATQREPRRKFLFCFRRAPSFFGGTAAHRARAAKGQHPAKASFGC